jgi:membrane-bound lytic murein transglycosylase D
MRYAIMSNILKLFLIGIFLVVTSSSACFGETGSMEKPRKTGTERKRAIHRKKKLLSALLFFNALPAKARALPRSSITLTDTDQLVSGSIKMRDIEKIYSQYGFNDEVRESLHKFSGRRYDFQKRLELSGKYVKQMAGIFSEKGLPRELAYLPLVESGFNPRRAAGIWQFMPRTAKKLGLKIDWWIDERRDPAKSTEAAARYLQYLHEKFGSWPLALAAYNAGEGRVNNALDKAGKNDFWSIRETEHIGKETRDYVPSYIAAAAIATHPERFGFRHIRYRKPPKYDEVTISRPMDFDVIARLADISVSDIRELNPELRRRCTPPDALNYKLKVPEGAGDRFQSNMEKIRGDELDLARFYTVKKGDTVEKIAHTIGTSIQEIVDRNGLGRTAVIMTGKRILVPFEAQWNSLIKRMMQ